jgi:hypothetical protein
MKAGIKKVLVVLGVLGLLASVVAGREKPAAPAVVEPAARLAARIELDLSKLESRGEEAKDAVAKADPFAQKSFAPPAEAAPPQPPVKPAAPPLPFVYLGKVIEDGKLAVFLSRGEENLSVRAGDTIGEYRVDAVTENEIRFTYLPLKTKQSLPL